MCFTLLLLLSSKCEERKKNECDEKEREDAGEESEGASGPPQLFASSHFFLQAANDDNEAVGCT